MSTKLFNRPPRLRELIEPVEVHLPNAPMPLRPQQRSSLLRLLLMTMIPAMMPPAVLGGVMYFIGSPSTTVLTTVALAAAMGIAVSMTTLLSKHDEDARLRAEQREHDRDIEEFEARLGEASALAEQAAARQLGILRRYFPSPEELTRHAIGLTSGVWERRAGDDDFMELRIGVGRVRSCVRFADASYAGSPELAQLVERCAYIDGAPVTANFAALRQAGMYGSGERTRGALAWLIAQAAVLHAPGDLSIAVFSKDEELRRWTKWLPHCRLERTDGSSWLLAQNGEEANGALRAIAEDLSARSAQDAPHRYFIVADAQDWPTIIARIERWIPEDAPVMVLQVKTTYQELSGECEFVLDVSDVTGRLVRRAEPGEGARFTADTIAAAAGESIARTLAPLRSTEAMGGGTVPNSARLTELHRSLDSADDVLETWERSRDDFRLAAPIGLGAGARPVEIDFRRDGPHALLAGTTGSGKSELLQSLVVSLAARVPPDLLNLLLIDYKGGSAFREVEALPHVVGVVTDLDARLSTRALVSLRAEMKRREHLLANADPPAGNIIEYQSQPRRVPLANLVILIDEFHRLVSEVPDFVEQMVQIAQQGRSLGVHLLLSTQKPAGVVSEYIRSNTNLRLSLRVTDEADSRDVLGSPEAAHIPRSLPGRMYVRRGHESLEICQAARISGRVPARTPGRAAVRARSFMAPAARSVRRRGIAASMSDGDAGRSAHESEASVDERERVVRFIRAAAEQAGFPTQGPPWQPYLPDDVTVAALVAEVDATQFGAEAIAIGIVDEPEQQRQEPFEIDLAAGHICFAGAARTGKSNALLAMAEAASLRYTPAQLHVYGLDFSGGALASLESLPHCGGVAMQHEQAKTRWLVRTLHDIVMERLAAPSAQAARILVLVDNFAGFYQDLQNADDGLDLLDDLHEVMDVGRSARITIAISVERPEALRSNVLALMHTRVAFALRDAESGSTLGLPRNALPVAGMPGRAVLPGPLVHEVQLARSEMCGPAYAAAGRSDPGGPLSISPLPAEVPYEVADGAVDGLRLGLQESLRPAFAYPLGEHLVVLGPRRSGRSNALAVAMSELRRCGVQRFYIVNARRASILRAFATSETTCRYAERGPDADSLWEELTDATRERFAAYDSGSASPNDRWAVILDDVDLSEIPPGAGEALQQLVLRGSDVGAILCVAAETSGLRSSYPSNALRALLGMRTGLLLRPSSTEEFDLLGVRGKPTRQPAGRGFFCEAGVKREIQLFQLHEVV